MSFRDRAACLWAKLVVVVYIIEIGACLSGVYAGGGRKPAKVRPMFNPENISVVHRPIDGDVSIPVSQRLKLIMSKWKLLRSTGSLPSSLPRYGKILGRLWGNGPNGLCTAKAHDFPANARSAVFIYDLNDHEARDFLGKSLASVCVGEMDQGSLSLSKLDMLLRNLDNYPSPLILTHLPLDRLSTLARRIYLRTRVVELFFKAFVYYCRISRGSGDLNDNQLSLTGHLAPLSVGRSGVDREEQDANYFNRSGYALIVLIVGWGITGWGWWRLRTGRSWGQIVTGMSCLLLGFPTMCLGVSGVLDWLVS